MKRLSLCISFLFFVLAIQAQDKDKKGYKIGDTIMSFTLKNVDGKMVSTQDYKQSKGIIIIFTCNHCPYSVAYEERIKALHERFAKSGFPVVAINPNDDKAYPLDSYENMIERASDKNFTFPYLHDETQEIAATFGATKTPHVFIVSNNNGHFVVEYIGGIDDTVLEEQGIQNTYVQNAVVELLNNQKVSVKNTKAIGCTIKWK